MSYNTLDFESPTDKADEKPFAFSELQRAWLTDLRSGSFGRGKNFLMFSHGVTSLLPDSEGKLMPPRRSDLFYCCLGVACRTIERIDPESIQFEFRQTDVPRLEPSPAVAPGAVAYVSVTDAEADSSAGSLVIALARRLGLHGETGGFYSEGNSVSVRIKPFTGHKTAGSLASLNDNTHMSFAEIADFIETHPRIIFKDEQPL